MTTRAPLAVISGQLHEAVSGDFMLNGGLIKTSIAATDDSLIPSGYQYIVVGSMVVDGNLQIDGALVLL